MEQYPAGTETIVRVIQSNAPTGRFWWEVLARTKNGGTSNEDEVIASGRPVDIIASNPSGTVTAIWGIITQNRSLLTSPGSIFFDHLRINQYDFPLRNLPRGVYATKINPGRYEIRPNFPGYRIGKRRIKFNPGQKRRTNFVAN